MLMSHKKINHTEMLMQSDEKPPQDFGLTFEVDFWLCKRFRKWTWMFNQLYGYFFIYDAYTKSGQTSNQRAPHIHMIDISFYYAYLEQWWWLIPHAVWAPIYADARLAGFVGIKVGSSHMIDFAQCRVGAASAIMMWIYIHL